MSWFRRLLSPSPAPSRRAFLGESTEGALADTLPARPLDIAPGTLVDARGQSVGQASRDGQPWVGEVAMFAGSFAPRGWAFCDGQLLAVSQNDALFSLLGTTYGGDGRTTFALPDLRGRTFLHAGAGPGLTPRLQGLRAGTEALAVSAHTHDLPEVIVRGTGTQFVGATAGADLSTSTSTNLSGDDNLQPFLAVHFIIALFGIYPSRQ